MSQASSCSVLGRIRSQEPNLRPAEASVARVILDRPDEVVRLSVDELSGHARVSTATITRFCQYLGFRGYRDLKVSLALELSRMPAVSVDEIKIGDRPIEIAHKVVRSEMEALSEALQLIDDATLEAAIEILTSARRVAVFGVGSSHPVALDAFYRLLRVGLNVTMAPESIMQAVSAAALTPEDAVLVFSHTGRGREVLIAARWAWESGAKVISITSFTGSPLLGYTHVPLVTPVRETAFRVEAMAARTAHLVVVDALFIALSLRKFESARKALERTQQVIDEQRQA